MGKQLTLMDIIELFELDPDYEIEDLTPDELRELKQRNNG